MWYSGKKMALSATKKNILILVLSEKKILNEIFAHVSGFNMEGWIPELSTAINAAARKNLQAFKVCSTELKSLFRRTPTCLGTDHLT
jgi:hypothetical protein